MSSENHRPGELEIPCQIQALSVEFALPKLVLIWNFHENIQRQG